MSSVPAPRKRPLQPDTEAYYQALKGAVQQYLGRTLDDEEFKEMCLRADAIATVGSLEETVFVVSHAMYERCRQIPVDVAAHLAQKLGKNVESFVQSSAAQGQIKIQLTQESLQAMHEEVIDTVMLGRRWILLALLALLSLGAVLGVSLFDAGRIYGAEVAQVAAHQVTKEQLDTILKACEESTKRLREDHKEVITNPAQHREGTAFLVENGLHSVDQSVNEAIERIAPRSVVLSGPSLVSRVWFGLLVTFGVCLFVGVGFLLGVLQTGRNGLETLQKLRAHIRGR